MAVLEVFEHAHWARCSSCGMDVVEVAGPRRGVKFIDPRVVLFDVAWRLAVGHLSPGARVPKGVVAWQLFDGRAAVIYELVCAKGFQRSVGDSIHVGHDCRGLPSDWFEGGLVAGLGLPGVLF